MKTLILGGRVIDPANRVDAMLNLLIDNGKIAWVGTGMPDADETIDATGKIVSPGFIDIHLHEDPVVDGKIAPDIFNSMLHGRHHRRRRQLRHQCLRSRGVPEAG